MNVAVAIVAAVLVLAAIFTIGFAVPAWLLAYAVTSLTFPQALAFVAAVRLVLPWPNFSKSD